MSNNESLAQTNEIPSEQAITIQPSGIATYPGPGDWMPAGNDPAQDSTSGLALLHAVRRHLLVILSTGLACAAVIGVTLYFVLKPKFEAISYLEVDVSHPVILDKQAADQSHGTNEFELYRDNQMAKIRSHYVIHSALKDAKLKNRPCILEHDEPKSYLFGLIGKERDTLAWLTDEIRVDLPSKNSGIIKVSATEPEAEDAQVIVNAVVDAYMREVIDGDRQQRAERLSELQKIAAEKETDVRKKREELKRDLESLSVSDERAMVQKEQLAASMYAEFQREFQRIRSENRMLLGKLRETKETLKGMADAEIPEMEVVVLLNNNTTFRELQSRATMLEQLNQVHQNAGTPGMKQPIGTARVKAELEMTKAQLQKLESETRDLVRGAKRIALEQDARRLETQVEISGEQLRAFEKEVEKKGNEAENVGRITIAAQMERAEVENLERILHNVADERERLKVEIKSRDRVHVLAPAEAPEHAMRDYRVLFILFGSGLAMLVPAVGIVAWDLRKERVNSAADVSKRLKIAVIGAVPLIPPTVMRRLGDATRKSQIWKMRFTESVDGVAARLLRKAECDQVRVVLITSALSGEGKTTLATQLAMSLARSQRRTVLVDFDLRQPTLDGALGLPLGPGICEALRGEGAIMDMVQQTETECLSVVTAGAWNRQVLAALSNGTVGTVLDQLRTNFDFVIIDSSPLLPIVDTRLVCQHVDSVVLSVFRDVSQSSKVLAAQEMLDAFGVRSVEAVVTGGEQHGNAKNLTALAALAAMSDEQVTPVKNQAEIIEDNQSKEVHPS